MVSFGTQHASQPTQANSRYFVQTPTPTEGQLCQPPQKTRETARTDDRNKKKTKTRRDPLAGLKRGQDASGTRSTVQLPRGAQVNCKRSTKPPGVAG